MFVTKSRYTKLEQELRDSKQKVKILELRLETASIKWNNLVNLINRKGGQQFLDHAVIPNGKNVSGGLDDEMVQRLLRLCHPDKHGNSTASNEATKWLLSKRK